MILVDTSVWIDHFRAAEPQLVSLLNGNEVLTHPCVIGEIALGGLKQRAQIMRHLNNLPTALIATHQEVMTFVDAHALVNTGVGYTDACLLASVALTPGSAIWTRDENLKAQAARCGLAPAVSLT
ncbi:MAG TPA: type II toxin-antitoxin system VapC family toxin [Caulobacterales bacterium]|nr:type II toxin-antitoxin system VapC family toxin [Caulobacterales bacterium]